MAHLVFFFSCAWLPPADGASGSADPCDRYVNYMCVCHPEVSCDDLTSAYANADASVQEECRMLHEEQEGVDAYLGLECDTTIDSPEPPETSYIDTGPPPETGDTSLYP